MYMLIDNIYFFVSKSTAFTPIMLVGSVYTNLFNFY